MDGVSEYMNILKALKAALGSLGEFIKARRTGKGRRQSLMNAQSLQARLNSIYMLAYLSELTRSGSGLEEFLNYIIPVDRHLTFAGGMARSLLKLHIQSLCCAECYWGRNELININLLTPEDAVKMMRFADNKDDSSLIIGAYFEEVMEVLNNVLINKLELQPRVLLKEGE